MHMSQLSVISINEKNAAHAAALVANFRMELKELKGISSAPNHEAGKEEILEYVQADWPCFAAVTDGEWIGYIVCRVEEPAVWVESIYVLPQYRRLGAASALFAKAEEIAAAFGENTVYNNVHPNNEKMISFLKKRGYTVLNLIEIRKPWPGENCGQKINVGKNELEY